MSTVSIAKKVPQEMNICQGDVFKNVRYTYIDAEDDDSVQVVEFWFPMAIIISQACDVNSMGKIIEERSGKSTKFMPSILMCPIYDKEVAKKSEHLSQAFDELKIKKLDGKDDYLFHKEDIKVAGNDWHYRFHDFTVMIEKNTILENAVIDFKHYFTVAASYLINHRKNRLFHIDDLYAEQITLKYATYLSRVAIP